MSTYNRKQRGLYHSRRVNFAGGVDPTRSLYLFEDFITDHIAEDSNVVVNQSGTPTTAAAISAAFGGPTAGHGGWIGGSVDNVDNEIDEVALGAKPWLVPAALTGGNLIVAEIAFVIPTALTARMYFAGLGDAETGGADDDGMLSIVTGTTLVSGATGDAAGFVYSSLATDADGYYTGAVKATSVGTALNVSTSSEGATVGPGVVDDYTKLRVEVDVNGSCYFYGIVSGAGARETDAAFCDFQNAAITAASVFEPIFSAASTTTTAVEWEIDYMYGGVAKP